MKKNAFTLIELLIVVAIIAILAAIAVPNFLEAQMRSKVSRARTDMRSVATGLEAYAVDYSKYPPMLGNPGQPTNQLTGYGSLRSYAWRTVPHNITTPVAYLTTSIPDVFKLGRSNQLTVGPDQGKPFESGNVFDPGFVYHNIKQYVDEIGGTNWTSKDLDRYGMWRMFSLGPDGLYNAVGTADTTMGWIYDPTNGTVSTGLILRTQKDPIGEHFNP